MHVSRPGPLMGVCILWAAFTAYSFYGFLHADLSAMPAWFGSYFVGITLMATIGIAGIWFMRQWGLGVYILSVLIDQVMLLNQHHWHIFSLLLPVMVIMVAIAHLQEMR